MAENEVVTGSIDTGGCVLQFEISALPEVYLERIEAITEHCQDFDAMGLGVVDGMLCQTYNEEATK